MRLLNAHTLSFKSFDSDETIPKYAILSHTWANDEVTYHEMCKLTDAASNMRGFEKIQHCAEQAKIDGIDFFWVDTCCIDKSSSAELSEAINSMFRWYENSEICYTYLFDVPNLPEGESVASILDYLEDDELETISGTGIKTADYALASLKDTWITKFTGCRWLTRGWTLQELIASPTMVFFSESWTKIGTKKDLAGIIQTYTAIPASVLLEGQLQSVSIAQKMSWATGRKTSRTEDMAYCLMGLFNVNMPMLYGEGRKAFIRLQECILQTTDDLSLFCWTTSTALPSTHRGLLARSPKEFARARSRPITWKRKTEFEPHQLTNRGIRLYVRLIPREDRQNEFIAHLWDVETPDSSRLGIYVMQTAVGQYTRVDPHQLVQIPDTVELASFPIVPVCVPQNAGQPVAFDCSRAGGILFDYDHSKFYLLKPENSSNWNQEEEVLSFYKQDVTSLTLLEACFELVQKPTGKKAVFTIKVGKSAVSSFGAPYLAIDGLTHRESDISGNHIMYVADSLATVMVSCSLLKDDLMIKMKISSFPEEKAGKVPMRGTNYIPQRIRYWL